jgi:hypothetical protein
MRLAGRAPTRAKLKTKVTGRAASAGIDCTSRVVRVQFTDPAYRDDEMRIGLRWEAVGVTGALFAALDADISLSADGERTLG